MLEKRRKFIKKILSISLYSVTFLAYAQTRLKESLSLDHYQQTVNELFKEVDFIDSRKIKLSRLPRTAENGAAVPITVTSTLDNVEKISILVAKNPQPLVAEFYLSTAVEARVTTKIKMAKSSDVIVIVEAQGKFYRKKKRVKVALGGCG